MDQDAEQLIGTIEEHRRNIEETVQEIEQRISPRQITRRWVDSGKGTIERLRLEGSSGYPDLGLPGGDRPGDATSVARGLIGRRPAAVAGAALVAGFLIGGIGR